MCEVTYDGDACAAWTERQRTARKAHICQSCGGAINPGDRYTHVSWVQDQRGYDERECAACHVVGEAYRAAHGVRWSPSQTASALRECVSEEGDDSETGRRWTAAIEAMQARQDARVGAAS